MTAVARSGVATVDEMTQLDSTSRAVKCHTEPARCARHRPITSRSEYVPKQGVTAGATYPFAQLTAVIRCRLPRPLKRITTSIALRGAFAVSAGPVRNASRNQDAPAELPPRWRRRSVRSGRFLRKDLRASDRRAPCVPHHQWSPGSRKASRLPARGHTRRHRTAPRPAQTVRHDAL